VPSGTVASTGIFHNPSAIWFAPTATSNPFGITAVSFVALKPSYQPVFGGFWVSGCLHCPIHRPFQPFATRRAFYESVSKPGAISTMPFNLITALTMLLRSNDVILIDL
jgi:hypothetical protein